MQPPRNLLKVYTDGAARGNPGPAAWAFLLVKDGRIIAQRSGYLGKATNNVAEYHAVIHALTEAHKHTDTVEIYSDSELVVRQITGRYRTGKEHLAALRRDVLRLAGGFSSITFSAIPREDPHIQAADRLCNETIDRHTGKGGSGRRNTAVTCTPIGVIRSPYTGQKAAPRQGRLSDALSEIIVFDEYAPALRGIERRSHLIVLYWLDQADRSLLIAVPPGQDEEFGVFSIRSPSRPNPIGFAVVDLIRRDGTRLTVRGLDAFDGTPVLDIKTYSAEFDCIPEAKSNKEKRAG